jgi:hypothetical protein
MCVPPRWFKWRRPACRRGRLQPAGIPWSKSSSKPAATEAPERVHVERILVAPALLPAWALLPLHSAHSQEWLCQSTLPQAEEAAGKKSYGCHSEPACARPPAGQAGEAKNLLSLKRRNKADSSSKQRPRNDRSRVLHQPLKPAPLQCFRIRRSILWRAAWLS